MNQKALSVKSTNPKNKKTATTQDYIQMHII